MKDKIKNYLKPGKIHQLQGALETAKYKRTEMTVINVIDLGILREAAQNWHDYIIESQKV